MANVTHDHENRIKGRSTAVGMLSLIDTVLIFVAMALCFGGAATAAGWLLVAAIVLAIPCLMLINELNAGCCK